jgi:hypothetical protein
MVYCGMSAWPPEWASSFAPGDARFATGEEGTLIKVVRDISSPDQPHLVLTNEYRGRRFSANLELDDLEFLNVVYAALQENCIGKPLDEVGSWELPD